MSPIVLLTFDTASRHVHPLSDYVLVGCYGLLSCLSSPTFEYVLDFYISNKVPSSHSVSMVYNTITEQYMNGTFRYIPKLNPMNYSVSDFKSMFSVLKHYELRILPLETTEMLSSRGYFEDCKLYRLRINPFLFSNNPELNSFYACCNKVLRSGLEDHPVLLDHLKNGFFKVYPITHEIPAQLSTSHFKLVAFSSGVSTYVSTYGIEVPSDLIQYFIAYGKDITIDSYELYNALNNVDLQNMTQELKELKKLCVNVQMNNDILQLLHEITSHCEHTSANKSAYANEVKLLMRHFKDYKLNNFFTSELFNHEIVSTEKLSNDTLKYYDSFEYNSNTKPEDYIKKGKEWLAQIHK